MRKPRISTGDCATMSEWSITSFVLYVHCSSRCRGLSGAKPAAHVERIPPQNALGAEDHHQDDEDTPDFPTPIGQELQGCREVRNDKGAQQWTIKHVHTSQYHIHGNVDATLEVEV